MAVLHEEAAMAEASDPGKKRDAVRRGAELLDAGIGAGVITLADQAARTYFGTHESRGEPS